eukprot:TRINITY_DN3903_c0_g1_i2.p1 TRINITY_DN3903_c0_g1~~TRINITY_DN3903_c0_g1_i2.p1  ORF type:complete len:245 (-),score=18.75 TRINITY_DN3903_c0_g1_i2:521-1168(-)
MVQTRFVSRAAAAPHPILDPALAQQILAFLRPSLMIRSTCRLFRSATEAREPKQKHCTVAADAIASVSLIDWAVQNGLQLDEALSTCFHGSLDGLRRLCSFYGMPVDKLHCSLAASGGNLEILQWLRQNGCSWFKGACAEAAFGGHLEGAAVGPCQRVPLVRGKMQLCCTHRALGGAAVGPRQRVPMGQANVQLRSIRGTPGGAAVGTRQWRRMG